MIMRLQIADCKLQIGGRLKCAGLCPARAIGCRAALLLTLAILFPLPSAASGGAALQVRAVDAVGPEFERTLHS